MKTSYVGVDLAYEGDPFKFWEILKTMKEDAEKNGIKFDCEQVITIEQEG